MTRTIVVQPLFNVRSWVGLPLKLLWTACAVKVPRLIVGVAAGRGPGPISGRLVVFPLLGPVHPCYVAWLLWNPPRLRCFD